MKRGFRTMSETIHVVPVNDLHEHCSDGTGCLCNPAIHLVAGGGTMIVHNSWDGRELWEEAADAV